MATKIEEFAQPAIVLRRADYGDYDKMVTLLSRDLGRIDAIARGVKRPKSRLAGATEPMAVGEFELREQNGRRTITGVSVINAYFGIREDYDKLLHAAYWLKLAEWVSESSESGLFETLVTALDYLERGSAPLALTTFAFEAHFLRIIGMLPNVSSCAVCGRETTGPCGFSVEAGSVVCERCRKGERAITEGARRILLKLPRVGFEKYELLVDRSEWREAASIMRDFVIYHVGANVREYPKIF